MVSQLTPNSEVQGSNPYLPSLYMYICIYLFIYLSSHRTQVRRMSSPYRRRMPSVTGASPDAAGSPAPSPVRFWLAKTLYE